MILCLMLSIAPTSALSNQAGAPQEPLIVNGTIGKKLDYPAVLVPPMRFKKLYACCEQKDAIEKRLSEVVSCPEPPSVGSWALAGGGVGFILGALVVSIIKK